MLHLVTDLKENAKVIGKIAQEDTSVRQAVYCCHHGQIFVGARGVNLLAVQEYMKLLDGWYDSSCKLPCVTRE